MDPVTAAGIGLSVASLALQVFSGCVKGYQMFIDVKGMPKEYEHLRTRMRIEQSRCLHWGESIGLIEEMLDEPSKLLQLNHNLVLDILHQIQTSFRTSLEISYKYDAVANGKGIMINGTHHDSANGSTNVRVEESPKRRPLILQKTLDLWEKGGRVASKVEWAMIKKGGFEKLIARLIQYNDRMESFLDRSALEDVRLMQAQSNLTMLQMADKVEQVRALVEAMHIARSDADEGVSLSRATTLKGEPSPEEENLVSLAVFKAHHLKIEMDPAPGEGLLIPPNALLFDDNLKPSGRQSANLRGRHVWVEWRESVEECLSQKEYRETVEGRVKKLAAILTAPDKPKEFRSPQCVGYCQSQQGPKARYGLVYEWPPEVDNTNAEFVSLRQLLFSLKRPPTLNARVAIAKMLAAALLCVHAVNWIHKDIRSENVLFASGPDHSIDLTKPILSGFEFSRPAVPEAVTVSHQFSPEHDLYRHPDLLKVDATRSLKSHDIYSLGLVLAEIALWQPVEDIAQIEVRRREIPSVRARMLGEKLHVLERIDERAGWTYADVVRDCVEGGSALNLVAGMNEEDPDVGAQLSNALYQKVVQKLQSIKM
ncbi:hypothetical protein M409DRAFT_20646 [Zasmidium cellare ATCC 36951]|uniref:Protein kinase domain-containing protein n=1 Tax=Zasmidium cellare ATCC 36951 TaxID=1080233 RepID=A0A6A6CQ68_ZASCE|nr:uncharacterized protein M409DRAFT_20646 [Zasmidium cellare ATCC 36951]KAF2169427.1 hypothetical protein M409DRAFT_20646 [Zasmidium cellare ATCC 36951]